MTDQSHVTITKITEDASGDSHFVSETLSLESQYSGQARFVTRPKGGVTDWHPTPQRLFTVILSGTIELTVSDGEVRSFGPGDVIWNEDVTGKGHCSRVGTEGDLAVAMFVLSEEDA